MLSRLFCEQLDAVAILASQGCAEPMKPLIRSAFEASLGVQYILKKDSERRALAYQVAHVHRQLKLHRKLDPAEEAGRELRKSIQDDSIGNSVLDSLPQVDFRKIIGNLTGTLAKPAFEPIEREWVRTKKEVKGDPAWFALFGGPRTIRALACQLGKAFWYEFVYSDWSDVVHAGSGMSHVAKNTIAELDMAVIRPLRHPQGLQGLIVLVTGMCLELTRLLLDKYGTETQRQEMRHYYMTHIRGRWQELTAKELIKAPWK
jgi:hypothetical protein